MRTTAELEERLARPSAGLIDDLGRLDGDIMILGAAWASWARASCGWR